MKNAPAFRPGILPGRRVNGYKADSSRYFAGIFRPCKRGLCVKNCVTTEISNSDGSYKKRIKMLVVDKITDLTPVKNLNVKGLIPENINLADDSFYVPGPIDCLLGAEIFYELLRSGQIRSENSNLIFQNTVFGFVASGAIVLQILKHGFIVD
ncbi:DUF1758 domain-containing protein [Trichonephila clavipes]|nr:DUF1758 domain-containing protein [Trichonephila clavipes]